MSLAKGIRILDVPGPGGNEATDAQRLAALNQMEADKTAVNSRRTTIVNQIRNIDPEKSVIMDGNDIVQ